MKIGVDAGCLGITDKRLRVGVFQVVRNLLIELGRIDKKNEYLLYSFHPIDKKLLKEFGPKMKNIVVMPSKGWMTIWLPLRLYKDSPDIFFALNQSVPFRLPMQAYKTIGMLYDIAFEKYPEFYTSTATKHKNNSRYLIEKADKIISISKATKNDIKNIYNVSSNKIDVAYPGILRLPKWKKYQNSNPYFLFVGALKKSKNVPTLLRAFAKFYENCDEKYDLILAGGDKWPDDEIGSTYASFSQIVQQHIKFLGFVDDATLYSLYKGATAFVGPSFYEGFGLPFVEAQRIGCPVIGSRRGALPEIINNSGILINPMSISALSDAMKKMTQKTVRNNYIRKGSSNIKRYSWKTFAKTVQSAIQALS